MRQESLMYQNSLSATAAGAADIESENHRMIRYIKTLLRRGKQLDHSGFICEAKEREI